MAKPATEARLAAAANGFTQVLARGNAPADIQNDVSEALGVLSMTGVDYEWTFSGAVGPFRYAVLYNDDHASDALIGYYDYGSELTFGDGEKFKVDFAATIMTITPT